MVDPDHYAVLGVPADASSPEIARAFRRLARAWHPDARPDDPLAPGRFRQIAAAYHVLGDAQRRAAYDAGQQRSARLPAAADRQTEERIQSRRGPVRVPVRHVSSSAQPSMSGPRIRPLSQRDGVEELFALLRRFLYDRW